jgi:hypothetical protein
MPKSLGLIGAVALVGVVTACSSRPTSTEHIGSTSQNIQGGSSDGSAHPFVVGVCGGQFGSQCQLTCSGALITPNLVVSARHCVDETLDQNGQSTEQIACGQTTFGNRLLPANQYSITTSSTMPGSTGTKHVVKQIITPMPTSVCGNDISLLILNDLVTEATPAIPGTGQSLTDENFYNLGGGFTAIGYGITSPNGQDSGTRRILQNIPMGCVPGALNYDCAKQGYPATVFDNNEFIGGDGTCQGDSGSSAWAQSYYDKGQFISMGVLSRGGQSQDGTMCQGSIYTRLDAWRDLIVQTATTASNNWSLYPKPTPDWTVYTPPTMTGGGGGGV